LSNAKATVKERVLKDYIEKMGEIMSENTGIFNAIKSMSSLQMIVYCFVDSRSSDTKPVADSINTSSRQREQ
jgi:hypothetical protein